MTYSGTAPSWDHSLVLPAVKEFLSSFASPVKLLDIGCGNGAMLAALSDLELDATGVDSSPSAIGFAQRQESRATFLQFDATQLLPFLPNSFDAIISVEVIEHIYSPRELLDNALRLLKPGGRILLTTPYHGYLKNVLIAATGKFDFHYDPLWIGGHVKFWSKATMFAVMREIGFVDLTFAGCGRVPYLWRSMVVTGRKP